MANGRKTGRRRGRKRGTPRGTPNRNAGTMAETAQEFSADALAKRSGIHRSYVSGLEAGQRNPTALTLQRLAKVLGVTPVVFFL